MKPAKLKGYGQRVPAHPARETGSIAWQSVAVLFIATTLLVPVLRAVSSGGMAAVTRAKQLTNAVNAVSRAVEERYSPGLPRKE